MQLGKVLIVDDMETNLHVAAGFIECYGIAVDMASDGPEAIEMVRRYGEYLIVFMDHLMPEMDGVETTAAIREMGCTFPIIALTGNTEPGQNEMFLQNGFNDYLPKPLEKDKLTAILSKYIRGFNADISDGGSPPEINPRLLDSFLHDSGKAGDMLDRLLHNDTWVDDDHEVRTFTITVHGIASSLYNIGAARLAAFAKRLEAAGRNTDKEMLRDYVPAFSEELREVIDRLREKQNSTKTAGTTNDAVDLYEKFREIKEMCAEYNRKGALEIIGGITACLPKTREILNKIKENVYNGDFEEAEIITAEYLSPRTIQGLDTKKGLERYNGNEETYVKILRSYAGSISTVLKSIETVDENDLNTYKIKVHGIKGASYDIFAEETGKKAEALENAANTNDIGFIRENHRDFIISTKKLLNDINEMVHAVGAATDKPQKDKPDEGLLLKLKNACGDFNLSAADAVMSQIEAFQYTEDGGLVDWLRENVGLMNYADVVEKLSSG